MKTCSVNGCDSVHYGKGYCNKHYQQIRKHGRIVDGEKRHNGKRKYHSYEIIENGLTIKAYTTKDEPFYLDIEDFPQLNKGMYSINKRGYLRAYVGPGITKYLHRRILKAPAGMDVDHIDGDPLNNRKSNLRICTHQHNLWNSKIRNDNTSGVKGVYWDKKRKYWYARIEVNGKGINLGKHKNKEDAIKIRKEKEKEYFKEYVCERCQQ